MEYQLSIQFAQITEHRLQPGWELLLSIQIGSNRPAERSRWVDFVLFYHPLSLKVTTIICESAVSISTSQKEKHILVRV